MRHTYLTCTLVASMVLFTACSPYKSREDGFSKVGFEETQLKDGSYKLSYFGSTLDTQEEVEQKWHRRANELCGGDYSAETEVAPWGFDTYIVVPPLLFKNHQEAPGVEGKLRCNS